MNAKTGRCAIGPHGRQASRGHLQPDRRHPARELRARADQAKTYAHDDLIVVVLRGMGLTPLEKTMMDSGDPGRVVDMRHDFQRVMADRYQQTIEELTGRTVVAFLSQAHVAPDITMETFFLDRPLEVFGAVEIINPE